MGRRVAALGAGLLLAVGCASAPPAVEKAGAAASGAAAVDAPVPPLPPGDSEGTSGATPEKPASGAPGDIGAAAAAPPATAASEPPPARPPASEPVRRQLIVIDHGSSEVRPEPGELAHSTRRDAAASPGAPPRVTNDNLADYARRGRVTMSGGAAVTPGDPAAAEAAGETETAAAASGEAPRDEAWWRARAREIREEWRRTVDEIGELEEAAADLRWRFYAEDDPWIRDGQVKPEWDRALDRLSGARRRLDEYPRRLEALIEEGRREGALPGWLREGVELEPRPEELPGAEPDPAEPVEPRPVDDDPRGGR